MAEEARFSDISSVEELLACHKKEKKDLIAKTQKMKHSVSKSDKKKKKEVTAEITQMLADLDLKLETELEEFKLKHNSQCSTEDSNESLESEEVLEGNGVELPQNVTDHVEHEKESSVENAGINASSTQRVSKAQKRRNKKAALERERNEAILSQELENRNGLRHRESEQIQKKLAERKLAIFEINPDGNCLYRAIEHQLSVLNIKPMSVQTLRDETSHYLLSHFEEFLPFFTDPETGDPFTEDMYVKYCDDLAKTTAWGGHVEIQVLSRILSLPIEVIQADGPNIITMSGDDIAGPRITLCYHRHVYSLGEHYNSVIPMPE